MRYSITILGLAAVASARLTSIFNITGMSTPSLKDHVANMKCQLATPEQVVNNSNVPTPGQPGAVGQFNYALYSDSETICYDITLRGVAGTYQSPARTATHIHEAAVLRAGPPRIAFPNPVGDDSIRRSSGCVCCPCFEFRLSFISFHSVETNVRQETTSLG
jgi:hypothetical protein